MIEEETLWSLNILIKNAKMILNAIKKIIAPIPIIKLNNYIIKHVLNQNFAPNNLQTVNMGIIVPLLTANNK